MTKLFIDKTKQLKLDHKLRWNMQNPLHQRALYKLYLRLLFEENGIRFWKIPLWISNATVKFFFFDVFFNRTSSLSHSITPPLHHSLSSASHLIASLWPTARPCGAATQHNTARISKSFISDRLLIPTRGEDHRELMCVSTKKKKKRERSYYTRPPMPSAFPTSHLQLGVHSSDTFNLNESRGLVCC